MRCFLHWVLLLFTGANSQHLLKNPPIKGSENLPLTQCGLDLFRFPRNSAHLSIFFFYHFRLFCHSSVDASDSSSVTGEAALSVSKTTCWRVFIITRPCRFIAKDVGVAKDMAKSWDWWWALSFRTQHLAVLWLVLVFKKKVMTCKVFCGVSL